jgi:hypothetical protein
VRNAHSDVSLSSSRKGNGVIKSLVIISGLALSVSANAQSFSQRTIDTAILPDLIPGENSCLEPGALSARACEPVAALLQSIKPVPAGDRAVISTADVLQLCGAHKFEMWYAGWLR